MAEISNVLCALVVEIINVFNRRLKAAVLSLLLRTVVPTTRDLYGKFGNFSRDAHECMTLARRRSMHLSLPVGTLRWSLSRYSFKKHCQSLGVFTVNTANGWRGGWRKRMEAEHCGGRGVELQYGETHMPKIKHLRVQPRSGCLVRDSRSKLVLEDSKIFWSNRFDVFYSICAYKTKQTRVCLLTLETLPRYTHSRSWRLLCFRNIY